ncbi:hypothetical protein BH09MYX1_BH09MYX1_67450 [soil metagenome]
MQSGRIFAVRRLSAPSLDAFHEDAEVRTPHLRIALRSGMNVTTDYALVGRAIPFAVQMRRPQISIVLAGRARAEENGRRVWLSPGEVLASDGGAVRGGTMAYTGPALRQLLVEWDPAVFGAAHDRSLETSTLSATDLARLDAAATRAVTEETSALGIAEVFALLRAIGAPLAAIEDRKSEASRAPVSSLHAAVADQLSALARFPSIDDLASRLDSNQRRLHRHIRTLAERFSLPWNDWRSALHSQRILDATRLLAAPGATTEVVARLTGFRSPTSLCHAFAKAGLPSPGTLARAAQREVLDAWATIERRPQDDLIFSRDPSSHREHLRPPL